MLQVPDGRTSKIPPAAANANGAENCCEKIDYKKREVSSHATVAASQSLIGSKNRVRPCRRPSAIHFVLCSLRLDLGRSVGSILL